MLVTTERGSPTPRHAVWSRSSRTLVFFILVLTLVLATLIASPRSYSQSSSSSRLRRPCLRLRPLRLRLLPITYPQLPLPSLLLQSRRASPAPSFPHLTQLPVSSTVLTPPPLPCPFEHPLYHCTTDDPTHPLLLLSPRSALSLRVGWPAPPSDFSPLDFRPSGLLRTLVLSTSDPPDSLGLLSTLSSSLRSHLNLHSPCLVLHASHWSGQRVTVR